MFIIKIIVKVDKMYVSSPLYPLFKKMRYNENNCMIKICKISIFIYKKIIHLDRKKQF